MIIAVLDLRIVSAFSLICLTKQALEKEFTFYLKFKTQINA